MAYTSIVKLVSLSTWRIMHPNVRSLRLKFPSLLLHKDYDIKFPIFLFFNTKLLTQQTMAPLVVLRRKTPSKFIYFFDILNDETLGY